jgi:imidazolonepropionase-like amidohydrolase
VADFGTYPETFEPMRRLLREGVIPGPRIHLAARITTPGGHGAEGGRGDFFSLEVITPEEARVATRRWLAYKPDAIKVFTDGWRYGTSADMTSMEGPTLRAIVDEAHKQGVEVMTHTVTLARAKVAARAGVDVIAHSVGDAPVDAELVELLRAKRTAYVPTLAVTEFKTGPLAPLLREVLEPAALKRIEPRPVRTASPSRVARWNTLLANVATLRAAGILIAAGSDAAGAAGTLHGYSSLRELELLTAAGLTPLEAITAATGESAKAIHVDHERGTIAAGMLADLVLIQGAPHENIHDIERIRRVWLGGREIDRAQLQRDIATATVTSIPSRKAVALVDDVEAERTNLDTQRVNATDSGLDHSTMMFQRIARAGGGHALAIQARMSVKTRPFVQLWLPLSRGAVEPVDASAFRHVRFDVRGDGEYALLFPRRTLRSYNFPRASFRAAAEWQTIQIPLPSSPADLTAIAFEIVRAPGSLGWLEIDNVKFQ